MSVISNPNLFIYTALPCEAKPLIYYYRLKKHITIDAFAVYSNNEICLTVTGIGKTAMAAGIAYVQALFSPTQIRAMLNIGIAGHKAHAIGRVYLIDKIIDCDSDRRYYPPLIFTPPCFTDSVVTFSRPQLTYSPSSLCDMEASAFYETATRFTSGELVQCLKIISDNEEFPAHNIQAKHVSTLIANQLSIIASVLEELTQLSQRIAKPELPEFNQLLSHYHFTANEQIQLKKLLSRWSLIKGGNKAEIAHKSAKNGKEFLKLLNQHLNEAEFYL